MIRVYTINKKGVKSGTLKDLGKSQLCWTKCVNPSAAELKQVADATKLPLVELKEVVDSHERPKVLDLENYSLIVVRSAVTDNNSSHTTPLSIFVSKNKNNIITVSLKETYALKRITNLLISGKLFVSDTGPGYFTYRLLDEVFTNYFNILQEEEEKLDKLEDKVVAHPGKVTPPTIFSMKKTLILFHKSLMANREVVGAIEKEYITHIDKKNARRFRMLYNDVVQLSDTVTTQRELLTSILEIHTSSVSNNLNKAMKTLTVIASFVLIPTLITGIYGMNFDTSFPFNMPELHWEYGYIFSIFLMVFSVVATYWVFKKKEWI